MKKKILKIGVVADPQYADIPPKNLRYYSNSLGKLREALNVFKNENCDFIISLGDLIDQKWESFDPIMELFVDSSFPFFSVVGNHDFQVTEEKICQVPSSIGMKNRYYSMDKDNWSFVFLDGNDLSLYAPSRGCVEESQSLWQMVEQEKRIQAKDWNGGMSQVQLLWLNDQLKKAQENGKMVLVLSHFPVYPSNTHNLWNDKAVLDLLEDYDCVKAYVSGHNHAGGYGIFNHIHFLTLKGMVETQDENAFALLSLHHDRIVVEGMGREENRTLAFK